MFRLVRYIPIFRGWGGGGGGGGGLLKVQKECDYVIMLKMTLVVVKNVFFGLKKGISG